jgi:hypothetical protein
MSESRLDVVLPLVAGIAVSAVVLSWSGCATQAPVERSARVSVEELKAPAAHKERSLHLPRVMLLIDEKSLGTIPTAEVEALAVSKLLAENVTVVDQDMVRAEIAKGQKMLKMAGDNRGAVALGLQFGADVVIMGEAVAKPSARRIAESNLRTYQAVATLRAVRTDNSMTIASASEDSSIIGLEDVAGSSKALKGAGEKALDALIPELLTAWKEGRAAGAVRGAVPVSITVGGVDQMWKVKAVREGFESLSGVREVAQRSYTAGVAEFMVEASVPAEQLSEAIVLSPPKGLKMQVLEVGPGKIGLRVVAAR